MLNMGEMEGRMRDRPDWARWGLAAAALILACTPAASQTRPTPGAATKFNPAALKLNAAGAPIATPPSTTPPASPPPGGVDWKGVLVGQRQTYGQGPKLAGGLGLDAATVDRTAIPILLPQGAPFESARIYSFGDYYAISADVAGAGWALTGTTAKVDLPASVPLRTQLGPEQLVIQRTIDGQLASFVRFGVLYTVELRCDEPGDARCRDEVMVRDLLARTNVVVMGKAARQAAGMGG